jgi:uncharacterized protein YecT (DUF1311 family)
MRGLVAVIGLVLAQPAAAQSLSVDEEAVRQCHGSAETGVTAPRCLGHASNTCQDQAGGSTTLGIVECIRSETAVWDDLLNEQYKSTRDAFKARGDDLAEALVTAQKAWIDYRDAECSLHYERWIGGTIRTIVHANCMMGFTSTRALELRDMRGEAG